MSSDTFTLLCMSLSVFILGYFIWYLFVGQQKASEQMEREIIARDQEVKRQQERKELQEADKKIIPSVLQYEQTTQKAAVVLEVKTEAMLDSPNGERFKAIVIGKGIIPSKQVHSLSPIEVIVTCTSIEAAYGRISPSVQFQFPASIIALPGTSIVCGGGVEGEVRKGSVKVGDRYKITCHPLVDYKREFLHNGVPSRDVFYYRESNRHYMKAIGRVRQETGNNWGATYDYYADEDNHDCIRATRGYFYEADVLVLDLPTASK